jgi:hypothetical protein
MNYKFLIKPLFYIFNLLFASWLVLKIEQMKPSDLGRYGNLFTKPQVQVVHSDAKTYVRKLFSDYNHGAIDSAQLRQKLETYLDHFSQNENSSSAKNNADK